MKLSFLSGLFPIVMFAIMMGCGFRGPQQVAAQAPPPTVEITTVTPSDADIFAEYPAQTYARDMVDVRGRVEGYIEKWLFRPGQEVTAGQPLYVLDLRPFQAQVQQAQGTLQQTEADLSFAQPFTALSYVTVLALSHLLLHEHLSAGRMGGVGLILTGVFLISRTPSTTVVTP